MQREAGVLILQDGQEFPGFLFGDRISLESISTTPKDVGYGEVVFNTSMTGYQEILTDPSYRGQIICMTAAHIGNTGMNLEDSESTRSWCGGLAIRNLCDLPSNWRSTETLEAFMIRSGIPGISDIDTRGLTRHLRSKGVVRGIIVPLADRTRGAEVLKSLPQILGRDLIAEVTTRKAYPWPATTTPKYRVVVLDYGVKLNLLRSLAARGCELEILPAQTQAAEILAKKPDGVFLSNGPGDPTAAPYAVQAVKDLLGKIPLFGVCMGHQILALALGASTYKMKFGHRGGNQPVLNHRNTQVEISSHNHGFSIDEASLPSHVRVTHINLNDGSVEGIEVPDQRAFSVQFHPESCPGPHDSLIHFDHFIQLMG